MRSLSPFPSLQSPDLFLLQICGNYDGDETNNGHMENLENAEEWLTLFKENLLNFESHCVAFADGFRVLHVASVVPGILVTNS
ncbi:hypothetical protein M8C21_010305 [Ambrosia artemisiifolia]|uniref:Uncharacterized protein n=1 Tax=Ambrosia artemisiifolia TaxID=4212 RepID=A0AAD5GP78_AMBAR|nr:hypothetical protein M8C21_010305 [Ambrosia artemisiifolia]